MKIKLNKNISKKVDKARGSLTGAGKALVAGVAGVALMASNLFSSAKEKTVDLADRAFHKNNKKSEEGFFMKKSTFVALVVALAAVASVLGALYFYVLRRERELDEYEQLLFSEDFNDELPDDLEDVEDAE